VFAYLIKEDVQNVLLLLFMAATHQPTYIRACTQALKRWRHWATSLSILLSRAAHTSNKRCLRSFTS